MVCLYSISHGYNDKNMLLLAIRVSSSLLILLHMSNNAIKKMILKHYPAKLQCFLTPQSNLVMPSRSSPFK